MRLRGESYNSRALLLLPARSCKVMPVCCPVMPLACETADIAVHGAAERPSVAYSTAGGGRKGPGAAGGPGRPSEVAPGQARPGRESWARKMDFLMSGVAYGVGLGNVWRFPYLCYKNGGGAFLVPYGLTVVCVGIPLFFLEVALGQLTQQGTIGVWKIVPLFTGVGVASMVVVFLSDLYYIVVLAWSLYYLLHSLTTAQLPWTHCQGWWATAACSDTYASCPSNASGLRNVSLSRGLGTSRAASNASEGASACQDTTSPAVEFWERNVLRVSSGMHDLGSVNWEMLLCLLAVWLLVYFSVWKGIKFSGKVVYVTGSVPYVLLLVLLVQGVMLPGALDGITYYLQPDWAKLATPQVWVEASTQVFYCYGVGFGVLPALGSYNKFHNNCYRDSIILTIINSATSFFSGFVVFSFLGFMAQEQGVDISHVAETGPGLVFVVYPRAISLLPVPALWATLLFIMLLLLGVDSEFAGMEGFVTGLTDLFPSQLSGKRRREAFTGLCCLVSFLLSVTMVTQGGIYVFQLFDSYAASGISMLWLMGWECIAVAWVYGANRFMQDLTAMLGFRPHAWVWWCWSVVSPAVCLVRTTAAALHPQVAMTAPWGRYQTRGSSCSIWCTTSGSCTTAATSTPAGPRPWVGCSRSPPCCASRPWHSTSSPPPRAASHSAGVT
ncbi:sodium- and chloride-dependent creatine transporter 1-like isoform X2 [Petromyzon marinus]|uniref:sodium- and chloride-dependent creatine transporter 1-like isoform X2 n=1 Tax=Petromyzon marinus TaxID=7757 RepID=UPI003F7297D0